MKTITPREWVLDKYGAYDRSMVDDIFIDRNDFISACKDLLNVETYEEFPNFYEKWDIDTTLKKLHFLWKAQGLLFTRDDTGTLEQMVKGYEEMIIMGFGKAHTNEVLHKENKNKTE